MNFKDFGGFYKLYFQLFLLLIISVSVFACRFDDNSRKAEEAREGNKGNASLPEENRNALHQGIGTSEKENAVPEILPGLEAKYYQDSDGNAIPDFMEIEMGKNPAENDCRTSDCGDAAELVKYFEEPHHTLLILDASGSMKAGGKMSDAKTAIRRYMSQKLPANFKTGLMVYGHQGNNSESGKQESCTGIELLAPLGEFKTENSNQILERFEPTGWTPIGASLEKAQEVFKGLENADNAVVLVSDGIETCGGNPVETARRLHESGLKLRIDVVGFGVGSADAARLKEISDAGGGEYINVNTGKELLDYFQKRNEAFGKTVEAFQCQLKNVYQSNNCDQLMVNQATVFRLLPTANQARREGREQEAAALDSLARRIEALKLKRDAEMEKTQSKIRELEPRLTEFYNQMNRDRSMDK